MKPFPDRTATPLEWIQPRTFDRYFELRAGNDLLGTLCWQGVLSNLATAKTVYGSWTLEQIGILSQRVEVREAGTEALLATYHPKLMGNGVLEFADGRVLVWEPTNFWSTDWSFFDEADNSSVALKEGVENARWRDMFKTQMTATVEQQEAWTPSQLALLAALGLYLILLRQQAVAGAATATATVV